MLYDRYYVVKNVDHDHYELRDRLLGGLLIMTTIYETVTQSFAHDLNTKEKRQIEIG